ncbi:hypothetical protein POX_d05600 [Penicillium oxalicum]|uniref:hypothetical protein n=1 Tax=Penicillium oxalicum TaxID=69781 RepID=UPI0020B7EF82|nr:hypothetical protein POX_d05600 [Penicillium oxalicum]KAI2790096.1 hypothetical protein POX_d05600 [Penicillium oxalicum]
MRLEGSLPFMSKSLRTLAAATIVVSTPQGSRPTKYGYLGGVIWNCCPEGTIRFSKRVQFPLMTGSFDACTGSLELTGY